MFEFCLTENNEDGIEHFKQSKRPLKKMYFYSCTMYAFATWNCFDLSRRVLHPTVKINDDEQSKKRLNYTQVIYIRVYIIICEDHSS